MPPSSPDNGLLFGGDAHFAPERCIGMFSDPQTMTTNVLYFYYCALTMDLLLTVPLGAQRRRNLIILRCPFVPEVNVEELSMPRLEQQRQQTNWAQSYEE